MIAETIGSILLGIVGIFFFVIAILFLVIGIFNKSKNWKTAALITFLIPLFCLVKILYSQYISVPAKLESEKIRITGTYIHAADETNERIILAEDGNYTYTGKNDLEIKRKGSWSPTGIGNILMFENQVDKYMGKLTSDSISETLIVAIRNDSIESFSQKTLLEFNKIKPSN